MNEPVVLNDLNSNETSVTARGDGMLVAEAASGNSAAFEALVARHKGIVFSITRRMTGSPVDAEDLTQQTFMKAFVHLSRFRGSCSFCTWLVSIAVNEARMWNRKRRNSRVVSMTGLVTLEDSEVALEFPDLGPDPEASYSQKEWNQLLSSAMERLNPGMREALQLCDLEEQSTITASLLLGIGVNAVKSRRFRGRAALRRKLESRLSFKGNDRLKARAEKQDSGKNEIRIGPDGQDQAA
jgi:RNA polymerase sigma-70 factor (ECF subfamily)